MSKKKTPNHLKLDFSLYKNPAIKKYLTIHNSLKLQLELIPKTSWDKNVRNIVSSSQWQNIRTKVFNKSNYSCEICGFKGDANSLECHEVWYYDLNKSVQKLISFRSLCRPCHAVKHFGRAVAKGNYNNTYNHFKRINNLDDFTASNIIKSFLLYWESLNNISWKIDTSLLSEYL